MEMFTIVVQKVAIQIEGLVRIYYGL